MRSNLLDRKISRKEFIKNAGLGAAAAAAAVAASPRDLFEAAQVNFSDNIAMGAVIGPAAPDATNLLWVDTFEIDDEGVVKYHNGTEWHDALAKRAVKLNTARSIQVNLASESAPTFDGTANVTPGVTGVLPITHGGTGRATHTTNSVLTGNGTGAVNNVATADGAFFATGSGAAPSFGTLPVAQGGTGATSAADARTNLGVVAGNVPMTDYAKGATAGVAIAATDSVNAAIGKLEKTLEGVSGTASSHAHGNITNDGKLGTASCAVTTNANKQIQAESLATTAPTASGTATAFITSVSQAANGKISASKSSLPTASTSTAGIIQIGTGATNAAAGNHNHSGVYEPAFTTLAISKGGTGATTAAAARNALGLGNTTGAVPVANGGTGATTAAAARTNLGLGTAAVRAVGEIPIGSASGTTFATIWVET